MLVGAGALAGCGGSGGYSITKDGVTTQCHPNGVGTGVICASVDNKVVKPQPKVGPNGHSRGGETRGKFTGEFFNGR
jgi:hypothetical protein